MRACGEAACGAPARPRCHVSSHSGRVATDAPRPPPGGISPSCRVLLNCNQGEEDGRRWDSWGKNRNIVSKKKYVGLEGRCFVMAIIREEGQQGQRRKKDGEEEYLNV